MSNLARQRARHPQLEADPYWANVVLYTRMDDEPPVDLSLSGHTITEGSGATYDTTDKKFGDASYDLDATANGYLQVGNSSDFSLGLGPFTIECWVYYSTNPASTDDPPVAAVWETTGNLRSWIFLLNNHTLAFRYSTNGTNDTIISGAWNPDPTTWYHLAVSCDATGVIKLFIDGSLLAVGRMTASMFNSSAALRIGRVQTAFGDHRQENIDELRITKGVCRYIEDFTPQRGAYGVAALDAVDYDPSWDHVVLHTDFETKDIPPDNSYVKHDITLGSGVSLNTNIKKFNSTALDTDNSANGYAQIADSAYFDLADWPFTIEAWVYFPSAPGASEDCAFLSQWNETGDERGWLFGLENQNLIFEQTTSGAAGTLTTKSSAWAPSAETWYHVAACRDGSNLRFFVDGTQVGTATADTATYHNSTAALRIGHPVDWDQGKVQALFDGVRITLGVARYTANFTAPTVEFPTLGSDASFDSVTALVALNAAAGNYSDAKKDELNNWGVFSDTGVTTEIGVTLFGDAVADLDNTDAGMIVLGDPYWDSVVLLTHLDHTTPIDVSPSAHTLTVNSATRDTTDKKFGASSYFFGTGTQNISAADNADWDFGTGDFTIECWVRFDSAPGGGDDPQFVSQWDTASNERGWLFWINNGALVFNWSTTGSNTSSISATWAPAGTTWYHIAVCRANGTIMLFIDGDLVAAAANTSDFWDSAAEMHIGWLDDGSGTQVNRNIDDVRITKGVGRYTESFTVPTRPHSSHQLIPTSGEFTIEGWIQWGTDPATADSIIAGQWNEGEDERGWQLYLTNNNLRFSYSTDGTSGTVVNTDKAWNPAASTWYHIAITRDSSDDMRWFVDGVQIGSTSSIAATFHDSSAIATLGETEDHVTASTQLYLANWRFTAAARYVTDFVVPVGKFATVLEE